ncbi:MAG: bifunctional aminotransferase class I/II-fold pyridoxal phosphate-dependent enzyme/GNAT family N-acetyltransferase [Bacteroidota bacterium]
MIDTLNQIMEDGYQRKLIHHFAHTKPNQSKSTLIINDQELTNFGSCSYLNLENHQAIKQGVVDAVTNYGTQFSSSRTYVSINLYEELENTLQTIFEKPLIVSASTTHGHLATIPVIVGKNDAVILDLQVHSSIQMTVQQLKAKHIPIHIIKHNCMESLENKIKHLNTKYEKIWYFADGVYSMYGDYAPFDELSRLLDRYEKFHLYIDDAHGMGWTGKNGCGVVRSHMKHHDKMVLAVSLNKSFATAGGCMVFPNKAMEKKVRNCGSTYIFCGPIQPPMLGAAIASAKLHLSEELKSMQADLKVLIDHTNKTIERLGLPQFRPTDSPVFFIPVGLPKVCYDILGEMKARGFYLNCASFPAVPMRRSGIRFLISTALNKQQISAMLRALSEVYVKIIQEHGSSFEQIAKNFRIPAFKVNKETFKIKQLHRPEALQVIIKNSIKECEQAEWDAIFGHSGTLNYRNMTTIEEVFTQQELPENKWDFSYLTVKNEDGDIVLKTFITTALTKDDMFAPGHVSEKIEEERRLGLKYHLTSKTVITGSLITKGNHVYINFEDDNWKKALRILSDYLVKVQDQKEATKIMIRDFYGPQCQNFETTMFELGFSKLKLLDNMVLNSLNWTTTDEYLKGLTKRYRYDVRREILKLASNFITTFEKPSDEQTLLKYYKLYERVHQRSRDLNVFKLPFSYFKAMNENPDYDFIQLYLKGECINGNPEDAPVLVGVMFSHKSNSSYDALIVGLDYEYVRSHNTYKQILYQTMKRANSLNCDKLDLAFTAELQKKKLGAKPTEVYTYVQAKEHYTHKLLEAI